jgi:hypothetical protein
VTQLPPLPSHIPSLKGPVPVYLVEAVPCGAWGYWEPEGRTISVQAKLTILDQWHTLFHEAIHMALADADVSDDLGTKREEVVCRSLSLWLVGQMVSAAPLLLPDMSTSGV